MNPTDTDFKRLVQEWRAMHEGQRFGQWLFNAIADFDIRGKTGEIDMINYDVDFHNRLFNLGDDELVKIIEESHEASNL